MTVRAACTAALLALVDPARADGERHPLVPDHAKVQLAGAIGVVTPGFGYSLAGDRLHLDAFLGWIPPSLAGRYLVLLTAKLTWRPWTLRAGEWRLHPGSLGLAVTRTFGERFWIVLPDRYPSGYYDVPTGVRASAALGFGVARPAFGLGEVGLYGEIVAVDAALVYWLRNRRSIDPADVFSVALGLRAAF